MATTPAVEAIMDIVNVFESQDKSAFIQDLISMLPAEHQISLLHSLENGQPISFELEPVYMRRRNAAERDANSDDVWITCSEDDYHYVTGLDTELGRQLYTQKVG